MRLVSHHLGGWSRRGSHRLADRDQDGARVPRRLWIVAAVVVALVVAAGGYLWWRHDDDRTSFAWAVGHAPAAPSVSPGPTGRPCARTSTPTSPQRSSADDLRTVPRPGLRRRPELDVGAGHVGTGAAATLRLLAGQRRLGAVQPVLPGRGRDAAPSVVGRPRRRRRPPPRPRLPGARRPRRRVAGRRGPGRPHLPVAVGRAPVRRARPARRLSGADLRLRRRSWASPWTPYAGTALGRRDSTPWWTTPASRCPRRSTAATTPAAPWRWRTRGRPTRRRPGGCSPPRAR